MYACQAVRATCAGARRELGAGATMALLDSGLLASGLSRSAHSRTGARGHGGVVERQR